MNHPILKDKLFDLYDGELTGVARQEVQAHLADCASCRQTYEQWEKTAKAFFEAPVVEESEAFVQKLMKRVAALEEPEPEATWMGGFRWLVPALGLACLLLLFLRPVQSPLTIETLLLGDEQENVTARFLSAGEAPTMDQVFGFILEDPS